MKNSFRFAACALALTAVCATAQFEVNGANASLTMQGQVPSAVDAVAHNVNVAVPGNFVLNIDSGVNPLSGIIMLASLSELTGPQFPTPLWSNSIDVGDNTLGATSVLIIADGIGFTVNPFIDAYFRTDSATVVQPTNDFLLAYSVNQLFCGGRNAWQAIVQDATNPPIFIDNTEAGDANYVSGQDLILLTNDDGTVQVPFLGGNSFSFHGLTYTDVYVCGNGFATFGAFPSVINAGFTIDAVSMMTSDPAIVACQTDWGIANGGPNDGVYYSEGTDPSGGCRMLISWGDPRALPSGVGGMAHFADADFNNQLDLTLFGDVDPLANPCGTPAVGTSGNFSLAWPRLDTSAFTRPGDGMFGHTPGGAALVGPQATTDMLGQVTATGTGVAGLEEHEEIPGNNQSVIGWDGAGGRRSYNNFFAATGIQVDYIASTAVTPGDLGYVSVPTGTPADDVEGTFGAVSNAGGNMTITGKFFGFGAGTVDITDSSATTFTGLTGTVISGSGPFFASEGLDVAYPPLALGPATATVNFGSGYIESVSFNVLPPCQVQTSLTLFDDDNVNVPLTNTVTHYGTTYTSLDVTSNGMVSFGGSTFSWIPSVADVFSGNDSVFAIPFGASICPIWGDFNRFGTSNYDVTEDTCTGETTVSFSNQIYWGTTNAAGNWSITMNWGGTPDQVLFNYTGLLNDTGAATLVFGYSDGILGGSDTDLATLGGIAANIPGYSSGAAPDSIAEALTSNTVATTMQSINGVLGLGTFAILNSGGLLVAF